MFRKSNLRLLSLVVFVIVYLVLGSVLLTLIEGPAEQELVKEIRETWTRFIEEHGCVDDAELEEFIIKIIDANNRGVSAVGNVSSEPNWSFGQSLFFAGTILTTIGYGHVTPLSEGGKIFCIIYAIIGIPLTLIMFTALVERLMLLTAKLLQWLNSKLGHLYKDLHIRLIHLSVLLLVLVIFIFLIPAGILTYLEQGWNYLDAFYYCFISMTTIGLGDYIPGDKPNQPQRVLYKICTTVYLFLGLVLMMLFLANIYEIPELNIGFHFYMKSDDDDPERVRLRSSSEEGPRYSKQVDEPASVASVTSLDQRKAEEQQTRAEQE